MRITSSFQLKTAKEDPSERFKTNIQPLDNPVAKLEQLRGVSFEWKESGFSALGVIAEEVARVLPEVVSWDEEGEEVVGVNYDSLLALLIEAAKVQQQELDKLTSELDDLGRQIEAELAKRSRPSLKPSNLPDESDSVRNYRRY